ncbi:MAG: cupin domain-containing protein [Gammaproteobacteria bacterium]|nr:cupin domain-containing protein [Gammaproteobacteria bacterium]MDH4253945.1 cupin domain-containing protein [Gammaproteobacteria bacterium]MDH5310576.1 cupin domain-containing protein [Gammaproteobacteria bacterium]
MSAKPGTGATDIEAKTGTSYPAPFRKPVEARSKRRLGDHFGLTRYGVNYVELPPGAWSAQRHWHTREDELVYVLHGELVLVSDAGEQVLTAGMVAGFPAGEADGHHLVNRSERSAAYLEVGDRDPRDEVFYPDIDLELRRGPKGEYVFRHRDGTDY